MNDEFEIKDVSDLEPVKKDKDIFMKIIIIMLVVLVIGFLIVYFFGYDILKPYIEV